MYNVARSSRYPDLAPERSNSGFAVKKKNYRKPDKVLVCLCVYCYTRYVLDKG